MIYFFQSFLLFILLLHPCFSQPSLYKGDYFDFSKTEVIKEMGVFRLRATSDNIIFDSIHGNIQDDILYDRQTDNFNFDGTYLLENINSKESFYLKFAAQTIYNNQTIFSNAVWLDGCVPDSGEYKISLIKLELIQKGTKKICTIGDSQTWWGKGQHLRRLMNFYYPDLYFVGSRIDSYGYPHEGEGGNSTLQVFERLNFIPPADIYTVLLGTNDYKKFTPDSSFRLMKQIFEALFLKNPECIIYYITPIPSDKQIRDEYNAALEKLVRNYCNEKKQTKIIELGEYLCTQPELEKCYLKDMLHPSFHGYKLIAEFIVREIKRLK